MQKQHSECNTRAGCCLLYDQRQQESWGGCGDKKAKVSKFLIRVEVLRDWVWTWVGVCIFLWASAKNQQKYILKNGAYLKWPEQHSCFYSLHTRLTSSPPGPFISRIPSIFIHSLDDQSPPSFFSIILIKIKQMQRETPKKHAQSTNDSAPYDIISYGGLQYRPSIECQPQIRTIIKAEEEEGLNEPSNVQARTGSMQSMSRSGDIDKNGTSLNHNFQKHAVVTIKKLTKSLAFGNSPVELIAMQMWNIFLSSGIKSKRILVILFGTANLTNEKYRNLLKGCYFGELCNYDEGAVRAAQTMLRERVVASLRQEIVRENIQQNRHIKLREQFYAYFMEFVENIRKGPLLKFRINAHASKRIVERISTSASLQPKHPRTKLKRRSNPEQ